MTTQTTTRRVFTRDVLSVVTGVSFGRIDGVYDLLQHVLDRPVLTHLIPAALDEAAPLLVSQFPWLAEVSAPQSGVIDLLTWVHGIEGDRGLTLEVEGA